MVILGYRIPKGTALMFPPHAAHLSPFNFSHPSRFWPDRWASGVLGDWDPKRSGSHLFTLPHCKLVHTCSHLTHTWSRVYLLPLC